MFYDITRAVPRADHRIEIVFDDGSKAEIDLRSLISFTGVFEALVDDDEFRKVRVNGETGTIEWPNGADLDPVVLYAVATGRTIEDVLSITAAR